MKTVYFFVFILYLTTLHFIALDKQTGEKIWEVSPKVNTITCTTLEEKDENLSDEYTIGGLFDCISHSVYINDSDDLMRY